ncbi:MAG: PP2C family serine/threonine-protein phosphatase [Aquificaceae bacterium]|nr:protein phosphatase 2C domain-containing protein [Aquificaceae bacterium]MDW8422935.1 PP2C family serine/threonine-protein phosphatase [Aquificaceae bacterium]
MSLTVFGFSVIGLRNRKLGLKCQDTHRVWADTDRACVVVCDGAGSASHSFIGSLMVCNLVLNAMRKEMETEAIIRNLRERLSKKAKALNIDLSSLACTLLAVYVNKDEYRYIHIGDGLIAYNKDGKIQVLSEGFRGEYANETVFVTSKNVEDYVISGNGSLNGITTFFVMSDGMEQAVYDRKRNMFGNILYKLVNYMSDTQDLKRLKRFIKRKSNMFYERTFDDFTLAILKRG